MDYTEILRKMLGTAEGAKPPLDQANAALMATAPEVKEPSPDTLQALAQPPAAPASPPRGNQPGDVVTLESLSKTLQDTLSNKWERLNRETQREMSPELAAKYSSAEKKLQGPSPEELGLRKTAMGDAEDQDFRSKRMRGIGLATNTLARAGGAADSSDFWKTQFKPEEAAKLLAKYELADSKQREQGRDELSMANNLKEYQALKVQGTTGTKSTSSSESETDATKQSVIPQMRDPAAATDARNDIDIPYFDKAVDPVSGKPFRVDKASKEKFRDIMEGGLRMEGTMNTLSSELSKRKMAGFKGEDQVVLKGLHTDLINGLRAAEGTGAPQTAELLFLKTLAEDPNEWINILSGAAGVERVQASLDTLRGSVRRHIDAGAKANYLVPKGGKQWYENAPSNASQQAPAGTVNLVRKSDGKSKAVSVDMAEKYMDAEPGAYEVK